MTTGQADRSQGEDSRVPHVLFNAAVKGALEGFTEFLPISSTGHLVLVRRLFPLTESLDAGEVERIDNLFDIVIQLPAVLAIVVLYRQRLWTAAAGALAGAGDRQPVAYGRNGCQSSRQARRFWAGLALAFLPAAIMGYLFHDVVEHVLMKPGVVAAALALGGLVLIYGDRRAGPGTVARAEEVSFLRAFSVGLCQCLALVPGVSRSGATIVGGRFLGLTREAAAEYSFFLALPTMLGAFVFKFAKEFPHIHWSTDGPLLCVGGVASFLTAWLVVAFFIRYLQRHSLAVFGWYRIVLGAAVVVFGRI